MPIIIIALITLLAGGGETLIASQNSLPGERLFPVKLATENFRLAVAMGDDNKRDLSISFAEKRVQEINDVLDSLEGQEVKDQHIKGLDRAAESLTSNLARLEDRAKALRSQGQNSRALEMNEDLKATAGVLNQALEIQRSSLQEPELRNGLDNAITRNEDLRREAENEIRHIHENESGDDSQGVSQRIEAVRSRVGEVEVEMERAGDGIRQESRSEAQKGLDSARDLLEAAGVDISAGRNGLALGRANEAMRAVAISNALLSADSELRNIEDNPNRLAEAVRRENRQLESGVSIEARILGNATDARVEGRFPVNSTDPNAIAQAIVDRLRLSRDSVANLIEIRRNEIDQLQTRSEARADVEGQGADVRIRMRFPLNTVDSNSIIQGIANRLAALSVNDVVNALDLRESNGSGSSSNERESESVNGQRNGRELELGDDRLFRSNPIPSAGIDLRGQEAELRGRANEPGEDARGQEAELRGRTNEPGEDIRGNADKNEIRGGGNNGIEAPGDQPRQEDRSSSGTIIDDSPGVSSGGSSGGGESSGGVSGGSGGGSSSGGGGGSSGGGGGGGGSSDD